MTALNDLKKPSKVTLIALATLLVGAIIFFRQRLFFGDASFIAFQIINSKSFCIPEHRYGAFITQMIPYMGAKLNLPIRAILVGYTVSFNLFYLSVAALLVFWLKQYRLAILMGLYYFLLVSDSYFWSNSEIHQGVAWMFLFFGVILHLGRKRINVLLLLIPFLILAFLTITSHFIAIIPTTFLWVYFIIENEDWPFSRNITLLLSSFIIAILVFKLSLSQSQSYDGANIEGIVHPRLKGIIQSLTTPVVKMFLYRCIGNYWPGVIVFMTGLASLAKDKKWLLMSWSLISCLGYFILMGLAFWRLDEHFILGHVESEWESITIIIAAPFVFSFLPKIKPIAASSVLAAMFIIRIGYILSAVPDYSWRTEYKNSATNQMKRKGITKLALYLDKKTERKCILNWALPFETILESSMNGDHPQMTFLLVNIDDSDLQTKIKNSSGFFDGWNTVAQSGLNPVYFSMDTTHAYQIMTYEDLMK